MAASPTRLAARAVALAILVAALGFGWEFLRFGLTDGAAAARVEREVRNRVADRTRQITTLAAGVARDPALVVAAAASRDHLPALFTRLLEIARPAGAAGPSATVYVTAGAGTYRVLA